MSASKSDRPVTLANMPAVRAALGTGRLPAPTEGRQPPRLAPIENPRGLKLRFAYWGMRHWMGKVLTPVKVVNARVPESLAVTNSFLKFAAKGATLDQRLQFLLADLVSQINGCLFCEDLGRAFSLRQKLGLEAKFDAIREYRTSPLFSEKERALLAYVDEATRSKMVSDATFEALRHHFSEREIVEVTLLNAIENFYNLVNLPLGIGSDGFCALQQPRAASA
jgi:alkylhydroperoxidase family enzyme